MNWPATSLPAHLSGELPTPCAGLKATVPLEVVGGAL